jgi:hypothetical protein
MTGMGSMGILPIQPGWQREFTLGAGEFFDITLGVRNLDAIDEASPIAIRIPWIAYHMTLIGENTNTCVMIINGGNPINLLAGTSITFDFRVITSIRITAANANQTYKIFLW